VKAGQGKIKGGGYEREVGAKISLWITNGERKDLLCRTVLSGGQFTMSSTGNAGDLMAQHALAFPFCSKVVIECKFWKNLELIRFLNTEGELFKALMKVQKEAAKVRKNWWLVVKQNHQPELLFMPDNCSQTLLLYKHALFNGTVYMYKLNEFLRVVPYEDYVRLTTTVKVG